MGPLEKRLTTLEPSGESTNQKGFQLPSGKLSLEREEVRSVLNLGVDLRFEMKDTSIS